MKKKLHILLLIAEFVLLTLSCSFTNQSQTIFMKICEFPFKQIGSALRELSLSSSGGNIVAIIIYVCVCLSPCAILFLLRKLRNIHKIHKGCYVLEDILIPLLSLTLFIVIYKMINSVNTANPVDIFQSVLGGSIYSIIIVYFIFKLIRKILVANDTKIYRYFSILLVLANFVFVAVISQNMINDVFLSLENMKISNSANTSLFALNTFFVYLKFIVANIPYLFNIVVVFILIDFVSRFKKEKYSQECILTAVKLSKISVISLVVILSSTVLLNIIQVLLCDKLFDVNIATNLPIFSLLFILVSLIFSKLVAENKSLIDDINSFI